MNQLKIITCALLGTALAAFAGPYDTWARYRDVTLNTTTAGVTTAQTNFPLLVRLTNASAITGSDVLLESPSGTDVRFATADGSTALSYEIERWTSSAAEIWVKVPSIAGSATTTIRMYWNKTGQTSESNGKAVFDTANGFVGVWHLSENGGGVDKVKDATANALNFTGHDSVPAVPGMIGNARWYNKAGQGDASNFYVDSINTSPLMQGLTDSTYLTISVWVKRLATFAQTQGIFGMYRYSAGNNRSYGLNYNTGNLIRIMTSPNGTTGTTGDRVTASAVAYPVDTTVWTHIVATHNPSAASNATVARIFINGAEITTAVTNPTAARNVFQATADVARPLIGAQEKDGTNLQKFLGYVDEIEFSKSNTAKSLRSPDWAKLSYETQKPAVTAVTLGTSVGTAVSTAPGAPTAVTGVSGNAQVTVTWVAPGSNGGSAVTGYKAMAVSDTTKSCTTTTAVTCAVTGLTNGTAYTFVVKATNAIGTSAASTASPAVTPYTVPGAPTGVTGAGGTTGQITVTWVAPASNGGSAVTGYKAMAVSDTAKSCTTTGALTCPVTGLVSTTAYTFIVRASNAAGAGATSTASAAVTGLRPNAFVIRVNGAAKPYTFQIPASDLANTESITMTISNIQGRTVWSKTVNPAADKVSEVSWNGLSSNGTAVSAGMYTVKVSMMNGGKSVEFLRKAIDLNP